MYIYLTVSEFIEILLNLSSIKYYFHCAVWKVIILKLSYELPHEAPSYKWNIFVVELITYQLLEYSNSFNYNSYDKYGALHALLSL